MTASHEPTVDPTLDLAAVGVTSADGHDRRNCCCSKVSESVIRGINVGAKHRLGRDAKKKAFHDEQELALRLWGGVLFELRAGIERVRLIEEKRQVGQVTYGTFDFQISDALLPELYRMISTPEVLENFRKIVTALKRVDFFQRAAGTTPDNDSAYGKSIGFAHDALSKGIVARFNLLVVIGNGVGKVIFEEDWAGSAAGLLPSEIDPNSTVDHAEV